MAELTTSPSLTCRCGHTFAEHIRGGGCIVRVYQPGWTQPEMCRCERFDRSVHSPNQSVVRGGKAPDGIEGDYL